MPGAPIDSRLTALGRRQAQAIAEHLAPQGITHVFASPYVRTLETAEPIRLATGAPGEALPLLHEHHQEAFGEEWPLQSRSALLERFPGFTVPESYSDHAWHTPPETHEAALERAQRALDGLFRRFRTSPQARVVLVSHGSPTGKLIQAFLGAGDAARITITIDNASLSILEERGVERFLHAVNRVHHLGHPGHPGHPGHLG